MNMLLKRSLALVFALLLLLTSCGPAADIPDDTPGGTPSDPPSDPSGDTPAVPSEYTAITTKGYENGPYLVETVYPTDEVVVANIIVTEADPTGKTDSTAVIQKALDDCAVQGGGTVFLPVGEYLVTDTVSIPAGVTLRGDWQDPDKTDRPAYGTVILAKTSTLEGDEIYDPAAKPLFRILNEGPANNGLVGLTVYYPEQDISGVKPYGYTVYGTAPNMTTLKDLTFINSYRGIGACLEGGTHEQLQIESVRMTVLELGYKAYASREVGYASDIRISPRFWMEQGKYGCPDAEALSDYTRAHTVGMEFGDLDLNQYSDIVIENCHTAMLMRDAFWGVFYDVTLSLCDYGVVVEGMAMHNVLMTNVAIDADVYAVVNYYTGDGTLKLTDLELAGKGGVECVEGARIMVDNAEDLDAYRTPDVTYQKPVSVLYVADVAEFDRKKTDAAAAIQAALDEAAATGGVVYVLNGIYSLYTPLSVPAGVELCGGVNVAIRDRATTSGAIYGTALISYVEHDAQITLADNAGVRGLRLFYPIYDPKTAEGLLDKQDGATETCAAIRGEGEGVYAVNVTVSGAMIGVDFSDCDDHYIKQLRGCAYRALVRVGGTGGTVDGILANQTYIFRQPFITRNLCDSKYYTSSNWGSYGNEANAAGVAFLRDSVLRSHTALLEVADAAGQTLHNCFMFAANNILRAERAEIVGFNVTSDSHDGDMFVIKDASAYVTFNALRTTGASHVCDESSTLDIYNRAVGTAAYEPSYHSSLGVADNAVGEIIDDVMLLDCDTTKGVSSTVMVNTDKNYIKEGSGSLKKTSTDSTAVLTAAVTPVDATKLDGDKVYLHLWMYVSETSGMPFSYSSVVRLGATSGGSGPAYQWILTAHATHDGWNELFLPLDAAWRIGKTAVDDTALQHLTVTLAAVGSYPTVYVDDVTLCSALPYDENAKPLAATEPEAYTSPLPAEPIDCSRIMLHDGESTDYLTVTSATGVTLNTDKKYVKQGSASLKSAVKNDQYIELSFPATNAAKYKKGYLHMWVYVEDISAIKSGGQIELTSGGKSDRGEIAWKTTDYIVDNGWNELWLPLGSGTTPTSLEGVVFDISYINYLRIHAPRVAGGKAPVFYFDDIYVCDVVGGSYDESNTAPVGGADDYFEELPVLNSCENTKGTKNVELCDDPAYVKQGDYSFKSIASDSNGRFSYTFMPLDITEYMSGYLHLWIYVENVQGISGQIEITSSGTHDKNELSWKIQDVVKVNGWNEVVVRLGGGMPTGGTFEPTRLNHLRIYIQEAEGKPCGEIYFDDIYFTLTK